MSQKNRNFASAALTVFILCIAMAGLSGCASKSNTPEMQPVATMSKDAQISYDYLVYQDQLRQLQRHAAAGKNSKLTKEEIAEISLRAESSLNRLLAAAPTPELYLEKAGLHWNNPQGIARSRSALRDGLDVFPDNRILTIYLANTYIMENRPEDAIDIMSEYMERHADDYQARERLAQMHMDAAEDAKALDQYKQIPMADRSADTFYGMGRAQGNLGMRKSAIINLKKAVTMDPGFSEAMVELAYQYELTKDYVAAEKTYTAILDQGQPFPEARLRLINLNLKLNNPDRAMELSLDGPPSKAFILDAVMMFVNDDFFAQGSTVLDMLTSDGEIPAEYYFYKAVIAHEGENNLDKAMEYLSKVKETDRLYPHALRFKAQLSHVQGNTKEALSIARKGKERYPNSAIFYKLESKLLMSEKDMKGAEASLKEGLKRLKGNPDLTYELGMLYEETERRNKALPLMEAMIRSHPDHTNGLNYVGYTLAEEGRELDRALVLVQKASLLDPENGYILDSVAWVFFKMNKLDEAWENIGFAVDIVENDPTIWEHYGDIAKAMGKIKSARKGYNYSLKYGTKHTSRVKKKLKAL